MSVRVNFKIDCGGLLKFPKTVKALKRQQISQTFHCLLENLSTYHLTSDRLIIKKYADNAAYAILSGIECGLILNFGRYRRLNCC
jgi:hypothetical protein